MRQLIGKLSSGIFASTNKERLIIYQCSCKSSVKRLCKLNISRYTFKTKVSASYFIVLFSSLATNHELRKDYSSKQDFRDCRGVGIA